MFTGIVTAIGTIVELVSKDGGGAHVSIQTAWDCDILELGSSVACSGVCLTVVERSGDCFSVDISKESQSVTNLKDWQVGQRVNLESALKVGDELGGHIVSGHVDGLAEILTILKDGDGFRLKLRAPDTLSPMIAPKGSVSLDGVSLTVNEVDGCDFGVMIIPHTWGATTLAECRVGSMINLEVDMLARYVVRALSRKNQ